MGCTHYILDRTKPVEIIIICYDCGKDVDPDNPHKGHEFCSGSMRDDYDLAVDIEIHNTRER